MRHLSFSWQGVVALLLCLLALTSLPLLAEGAAQPLTDGMASLVFIIIIAAALLSFAPQPPAYRATVLFIGAHGAAWMLLSALSGNEGMATRASFCCSSPAGCLPGAASRSCRTSSPSPASESRRLSC